MSLEEVDQYARGFIMFLFGTTLFADRANTVPLCLLSALVDVRQIRHYDWGGAARATLYGYMSSSSRLSRQLLGGYWRAWEVCLLPILHSCLLLSVFCTLHIYCTLPHTDCTLHTRHTHALLYTDCTLHTLHILHNILHNTRFCYFCFILFSALSDSHTNICSAVMGVCLLS